MFSRRITFLSLLLIINFQFAVSQQISKMNKKEITDLLINLKKDNSDRIEKLCELSLGTNYKLGPLGEGIDSEYDRDPLINFKSVDCMTFVEQILALTISKSYEEMYAKLIKIRYRDGMVSFKTRNHYTVADWLPANKWFLDDVTEKTGGDNLSEMTKTIDKKKFFENNGFPELGVDEIPITLTTKFIPSDQRVDIPSGAVIIFLQNEPGIFSMHMGFVIIKDGEQYLYHASSTIKMVVKVKLKDFLDKNPEIPGYKLCTIRE
jgi:hypothetical protein